MASLEQTFLRLREINMSSSSTISLEREFHLSKNKPESKPNFYSILA